jgi:hypothetical protein
MIGVNLFRVLPETLPVAWPALAPMLTRAVELNHDAFSMTDVARLVLADQWQLWTVLENDRPVAAVVTELVQYPGKRTCRVILLGGIKFDRWKHLIIEIENFALLHDCKELEALTRPGMARKIESIGFREECKVMVKDLRGRLQ